MATTYGADTRLCSIREQMGCLDREQIEEALELQKLRKKRVGQLLLDLGYVDEDELLRALSEQYGIPYETDLPGRIDAALTTRVPLNFIKQYEMAPFAEIGGV